MFDRIAHRYDLVNRLMTGGQDVKWRKRMGSHLPAGESLQLLDLATGTGDQALSLLETCPRIASSIGMDLSEEMLAHGREKIGEKGLSDRFTMVTGDAMQIPAEDQSADVITISFGIRNVIDVSTSLRDMLRVLRPGGRVIILECSLPRNAIIRAGFLGYFRYVMPVLGGLISGDRKAYRYLNRTVETFPYGEAFCQLLREAGFENVGETPLTLGSVTIYQGDRPKDGRELGHG